MPDTGTWPIRQMSEPSVTAAFVEAVVALLPMQCLNVLGSLCGITGIENQTMNNSASYLANWLDLVAAGQARRRQSRLSARPPATTGRDSQTLGRSANAFCHGKKGDTTPTFRPHLAMCILCGVDCGVGRTHNCGVRSSVIY